MIHFYKINKLLLFFLFFIITSCSSVPKYPQNACKIFGEKYSYLKYSRAASKKWNVPISSILAVINKESGFQRFAKPKRKRILGLIPGSRPSTAFGYAQVTNPTWDWYKNRTGNSNASRANFKDITDFIGWYTTQTENILGISKNDYYNQYLAYHEGHNGWKNKSYNSKKWLIDVAKNVERKTNMYNNQLKECEDRLNKKGLFGIF